MVRLPMNAKLFEVSFLQEHGKLIAIFISGLFFLLILQTFFFLIKPGDTTIKTSFSELSFKDNQSKSPLLKPLFGVYVPLGSENIEKSSLNINVVGIFYAAEPKKSQVLVEMNGVTHLYQTEDTLPQGPIIKQIRKDGIVIFYEGKLESLSIKKHELIFNKNSRPLF